jgi:hypothetical protein
MKNSLNDDFVYLQPQPIFASMKVYEFLCLTIYSRLESAPIAAAVIVQ